MKIPIPRLFGRAWDKLGDIANVTVYERGWIEIQRLHIAMAIFCLGGVGYYLMFYSWKMAVMAAASCVFVLMFCWIL